VTDLNDAPTATNLTSTSSYNEGDATVAITDIVVTDVDSGEMITATLTLNDTTTGSLSANDGATYNSLTGMWTITDTVANVNVALANVVFLPNSDNDVDTTITTHIEDAAGAGPADGTITLDVTPVNDVPTATNLTSTSSYNEGDASVAITDIVISDVDTGETITATLTLNDTSTGSLSANDGATYNGGTGVWKISDTVDNVNLALASLIFTPNINNDVDTTINVSIDDGDEDGSGPLTGTITLDVTPINDAPTITAIADQTIAEDGTTGALAFTVGDVETAAGSLTVTASSSNTTIIPNGNLTLVDLGSGNWTIEATPALNQNGGPVTITVTVDDGTTTTNETFDITVTPDNDAPTITAIADQTIAEDGTTGALAFTVGDVEIAAGSLTVTASSSNTTIIPNGNLTLVDLGSGNWTIEATPALNQTGGPVTITVTVDDGTTTTDETFDITVTPDNDAPTISAIADQTIAEDGTTGALAFSVSDIETADGSLTVTATSSNTTIIPNGNLTLVDLGSGNWTIEATPALNQTGGPVTITVTVDDGTTTTDETFDITVTPDNDAPTITAIADQTIAEDGTTGALAFSVGDVETAAGSLTVTASSSNTTIVANGNLTLVDLGSGNWTIEAAPALNQNGGPVTITVTVDDGTATTDESFNVMITANNDAPVINNATFALDENATNGTAVGTVPVTDPDAGDTHVYSITAGNTGGAFAIDNSGNITVANSAALNFETTPVFTLTVQVQDQGGTGLTDTATVTVNLNDINDAPVINNATFNIDENSTNGTAVGNVPVSDPDAGDTHVYSIAAGNTGGAFAIDNSGNITVANSTALNFETTPVFTLTVQVQDQDGTGITDTAIITVNLNNINDAGTVTIDNTTPAQGDILTANVIDPDGASGAITYQWFSDAVVIGGANDKTYKTTQSDVDTTITVTAIYTDDQGTAESLTSAPTSPVTNVNDAPVAGNDNLTVVEDQSMTFASVTDLLGNDSDMDGDTLTLSGFTQPTNGVLVDNGDGTFTYTPAGNFSDIDGFTYTVSDSNGGTATGAAIIVVTPVGDTPQVTNVFTNVEVQSGPIYIDRNANDGAEVTHLKISGITNGTLYLADGVTPIENGDFITVGQGQVGLRFTPAENSSADGSFNVESSEDGISVASQSGIATSTISILTTAPQPTEFAQSPALSNPDKVVSEETEQEKNEEMEDVTDEAETQAAADNVVSVDTPQISKVSNIKKASLVPGISVFKRADSADNDDRTPDRIKLSVPQTLKMLVKAENLGELKTALGKLDIATLPPDVYELVRGSLDAVQEEMGNEILIGKTVLGSAIATSVGLSAGYVVWMLKGGSLMASVLSSLPAWQLADPLAVLVGTKQDEDDDDESLETIIKDGSESDEDKEDDASESNKDKKESVKQ
jgi:hypothetical protein